MYKELRSVTTRQATASTPEMWARNFSGATRMNVRRAARLKSFHEWRLIRRVIPAAARVLDAGCGFGEWVYLLENEGYSAIGVDYSSELISRLRATYPDLTWVQADLRSMPVGDQDVDAVISWGVIEHDETGPDAALREFYRVVKPGGAIIVTVPRDSAEQRRASQVQFPPRGELAFFQYFMTEHELADRVHGAGFDVEETGTLAHAALGIFAPHFHVDARGLPLRIANRISTFVLRPFTKYRGMIYCVGRKPL